MIITVKGIDFIIDDEDAHLLEKYPWKINRGGYLRYSEVRDGKQVEVLFHRLIMGVTDPNILVDHRDRNPSNNRKNNLRITDHLGNSRNVSKWSKPTSSKYKGVSVTSDGIYMVSIRTGTSDGRIRERYDNEDIAGYVYNLYALKYFGEFASLNDVSSFTEDEIENSKCARKKQKKQSKYKGVSWNSSRNKWHAHLGHKGKRYNLGDYKTEEEAYNAYLNKKQELGLL